jgi:hypothetical protein
MRRLFIALPFLFACSTQKDVCTSYSLYRIPYNDSLIVSQWHEHVHFDNNPHCIYVPKEIVYYTDTIELRIPIDRYYYTPKKRKSVKQ